MLNSVKVWFYKHRKAVIVTATVLAVTGTVAVLLIRGKKVEIPVEELVEKIVPEGFEAAETITEMIAEKGNGEIKYISRKSFIRKLHEGWRASPAKIAEAEALGIKLALGETLVDPCMVARRPAA